MTGLNVSVSVREVGNKGISYNIVHDLKGETTLKDFFVFTKKLLQAVAVNALREEQIRGFPKDPIVVVDGRTNKSVSDVSPIGKIQFISPRLSFSKLIEETYVEIVFRSKIVSGTYAAGNFVFFNGVVVATTVTELRAWLKSGPVISPGNIVRFVNVLPYARKLERSGVTAQRSKPRVVKSRDRKQRSGQFIGAPNGVYFLSSRHVARKYKFNAAIKFSLILGSTLGVQNFPAVTKSGKTLRRNYKGSAKNPKNTGPYLYPSITITIGNRGVV